LQVRLDSVAVVTNFPPASLRAGGSEDRDEGSGDQGGESCEFANLIGPSVIACTPLLRCSV
jgi:hypothetical protein